jgi:predicted permease
MSSPLLIILIVAAGFVLKKIGLVKKELADSLMNLVFYIFLPATIFSSLTGMRLQAELAILPICGALIALFSYAFAYLSSKAIKMDRGTTGTFILASGAMNQALFTYPFFLIYYGPVGLGYAAFFDLGQAILALSFAYYIASCYGNGCNTFDPLRNTLRFPAIWALAVALLMNYLQLTYLVAPISPIIDALNNATTPLIMLSLGIFIEPRISKALPTAAVLLIRFVVSLAFAFLLVQVLDLPELQRNVVLISSAAPPAMLTLIYSSKEKLDIEYAADLISVSLIVGLIYIPLLFTIL